MLHLDALGEGLERERLAELHERVDQRLALLVVLPSVMNDRSIFSASTGKRWRSAQQRCSPVPKSSIATRTPSFLIAARRSAVSWTLRMRVVSVISIVSAARIEAALGERIFDVDDDRVAFELASGDVDRHHDLASCPLPGGGLAGGLFEHPLPEPP